ncbi:MAG: carbohydrate ABC transporter permease [Chloroflexi bacterium]|nr:carbohydrate ABC transporter permease [Chloroflexota bacterium]
MSRDTASAPARAAARQLDPEATLRRRRRAAAIRRWVGHGLLHLALLVGAVWLLLPLFFLFSTSLKESGREFVSPVQWLPNPVVFQNYPDAMTALPFDRFFINTAVITVVAMLGQLTTATLCGYGFARFRFPGRDVLFTLCLSTLMLPSAVTLIPTFILFSKLGWINTYLPLTVPAYFGGGAFFIFLCRQFFLTIPVELEESARIDGAGTLRIWAQMMLPLSMPVLTAMAIFSFVGHWNDFIGPLIYMREMRMMTVAVGLNAFRVSVGNIAWNQLMAASATVMAPVLILFLSAQRYFIRGIVTTGLSGR